MRLTPVPSPTYTVRLQGKVVPYTVRRSARAKHIRITINAHSGVVVTFPSRMRSYVNPDEFLREKQDWVLRHLPKAGILDRASADLENGSAIHLHGRQYALDIERDGVVRPLVQTLPGRLKVVLPRAHRGQVKEVVRTWMRSRADVVIRRETERLAAEIGVRYRRLTIRDQRTKWGSCSRAGNLSFNWRLILFPPSVLRYVIVHELCHLKQFNHSPRFWQMVERHDPRYQASIDWLKEHGSIADGALR
jgi:predicted metal-dependent hydrolase